MDSPSDNWLAHRATAAPGRLALRADGADLTYAELEAEASRAADGLAADGVKRGSIVGLDLPPGRDFAIVFHALMKLGAVAVPGQGHPEGTAEAGAGDGVVCRLYTSGTTGAPQPVDLTDENFLWSAVGTAFALGIDPADRWLACLPFHHVAGLSILTRSVVYGTGAVVHQGFDVDRVEASLEEDGVTIVSLVATQIVRLLEAGIDLSGPRAIIAGGGPIPAEVIDEAVGKGARLVQSYGMTETCSQVALLEPARAQRNAGAAGRPLLGAALKIADAGEILVRGPVVAPGAASDDGWLRTGDLGRFDDEGYLWVEGRQSDTIISGGENVMPQRVEDVLRMHPDVVDAAVVGRPDPEWQEAVTAVVVTAAGGPGDETALADWCRQRLERHETPKRFEWAAELPRTPSGKLKRAALR